MSDAMSNAELLSPGLAPRDLGPGEVERMFGPAPTPRQRLEGRGIEFVESETEMGGGGDADRVGEYFAKNLAALDKMGEYIEAQRKAGKRDDEQVNLGGQPLCSFGEYRKIYETIQAARVRGDRRAVEEIIREARRPAPPPPEPQPTPRPVDWRDGLPPEQQQRLREKEQRWDQLQPVQLVAMQEKIGTALSNWGLGIEWPDELKKANISPEDGSIILRALGEEISRKQEVKGKEQLQLMIDLLGLRGHFDFLKVKYKLTDDTAVFEYLKEADRKAKILFRNLPYDLFPLKLQEQIISLIRGRRNGGI